MFVHVGKLHNLLGIGGGKREKLLIPRSKGFLVPREEQDTVSKGREIVATTVSICAPSWKGGGKITWLFDITFCVCETV